MSEADVVLRTPSPRIWQLGEVELCVEVNFADSEITGIKNLFCW